MNVVKAAIEAPFLAVEVSTAPDQAVRVFYHTDSGHEVHDGEQATDVWSFPPPTFGYKRVLATVTVVSRDGKVVRSSRPIDPRRHHRLSESGAGFHHVSPGAASVAHALDQHPRLISAAYWLATIVLGIVAIYSFARGIGTHEALRFALAIILLGFAGMLGYEAVATTRLRRQNPQPTIARIAGGAFLHHPILSWTVMTGLCLLAGALIVHFTRLNGLQIWTLGVAVVAFLGGAIFGTDRWLRLLQ